MLARVPRETLSDRTAECLIDAIVRRQLTPGERIIEGKLATMLGVAKSTLREALQQLEHRGLVMKLDNQGTYITKVGAQEVEDSYAVRLLLEPEAAVRASVRLTEEGYHELAARLDHMRSALKGHDYFSCSKADLAFHRAIWRLAGSETFERALNAASLSLFGASGLYLMGLFSPMMPDSEAIYNDHKALLDILKQGGADNVRRVFREKLGVFRLQNLQGVQQFESVQHKDRSGSI
jgi:DNA-binding GntR family transcriptional regulator